MAKRAQPKAEEQAEAADLVVMATVNPLAVFTDPEQFSQFYTKLKQETDKHAPDVSTERGRNAVRSLAFKVTRAKTTLDKAGLGLTEEWRQKVALVNASRREMVDQLDALAAEVRRPLTEWENAEKARIERCQATIQQIKDMAIVSLDDSSETVRARGKELWGIEIGDEFGELATGAREAKAAAVAVLQRALERLTKEEADRAELEQLRAEQAEREERDRAQQERIAAEEAEQRRKEAAEAEAERIRQAEERAAQAARDEAARIAREAERERERQHDAAMAEERRQREEAEAREAARAADERRLAEEQAARDADRAHRAKVKTAATEAIAKLGPSKAVSEKIVLAIIAGEIPAVTLRF